MFRPRPPGIGCFHLLRLRLLAGGQGHEYWCPYCMWEDGLRCSWVKQGCQTQNNSQAWESDVGWPPRQEGSQEQKQGAKPQQLRVLFLAPCLILCGRSFSFSGSQFPDLQSGTNHACPTCLIRCVCVRVRVCMCVCVFACVFSEAIATLFWVLTRRQALAGSYGLEGKEET